MLMGCRLKNLGIYVSLTSISRNILIQSLFRAVDKHNIKMRVWERGSNETFACGTGACASAVAAIINDIAVSPVTVHMLGGNLSIEYDRASNEVFMTGPAVTVFTGSIEE